MILWQFCKVFVQGCNFLNYQLDQCYTKLPRILSVNWENWRHNLLHCSLSSKHFWPKHNLNLEIGARLLIVFTPFLRKRNTILDTLYWGGVYWPLNNPYTTNRPAGQFTAYSNRRSLIGSLLSLSENKTRLWLADRCDRGIVRSLWRHNCASADASGMGYGARRWTSVFNLCQNGVICL